MTRTLTAVLFAGGVFCGAATIAQAQQQPTQAVAQPLEVGAVAPDFELPGATRYGILRDAVRLSDFKGKTVVLAFFFKARTKG